VTLREKIAGEIRESGPIPFSRYMELCLYEPELGFYSRDVERFGKAGDFYTSSDVHAVFGRLLARQFEEMWRVLDRPAQLEILELGPGRGLFARDVLDWSEKKFPQFFQALHYRLMEKSAALRGRLESTLSRHIESGRALIAAVDTLVRPVSRRLAPEVPIIAFANEFFDALPIEILGKQGKLVVDFRKGRFVECWQQAEPAELEFLNTYSVTPLPNERLEISIPAQLYMQKVARLIERGFALIIDYGYTRDEQLAGRHRGTLMTFRQHAASANPYEAPGEQDITAHVNFTPLRAAAEQEGMHVAPLVTQSQFLLGVGEVNQFADAFEECAVPQERAKVALQLKHLITPAGMGESFHVFVASNGVNRSEELSGLSFGKKKIPS
jgi:SAM-dependent MidA family methyltransferase